MLKLFNRELAGKALSGLLIFGALAICFAGFARKQTIFESPCVVPTAGASYFGFWRSCWVSQLVENALPFNGAICIG